jgi:hypothetical protein
MFNMKVNKTIYLLAGCVLLTIATIASLYSLSRIAEDDPVLGNFNRKYVKDYATLDAEMDLRGNGFYFSGVTNSHVYLGSMVAPFRLFQINSDLNNMRNYVLGTGTLQNEAITMATVIKVDSPYFFLADGGKPAIYRGRLLDWANAIALPQKEYFTQIVPIGAATFGIRSNDLEDLSNILGKFEQGTEHPRVDSSLLQRQYDGVFCTDGKLIYNKQYSRLVYSYYYRNGFVVCDTNLALDYRGHTIDTFGVARMAYDTRQSDGVRMLTEKKVVNRAFATFGNNIYVDSNLRADNETLEEFSKGSVIDVYDLQTGAYTHSFRLPRVDDARVREFIVADERTILALQGRSLVRYRLGPATLTLSRNKAPGSAGSN